MVQARISEIQEALQETKAVQEMKEQVILSFISCKHLPSISFSLQLSIIL